MHVALARGGTRPERPRAISELADKRRCRLEDNPYIHTICCSYFFEFEAALFLGARPHRRTIIRPHKFRSAAFVLSQHHEHGGRVTTDLKLPLKAWVFRVLNRHERRLGQTLLAQLLHARLARSINDGACALVLAFCAVGLVVFDEVQTVVQVDAEQLVPPVIAAAAAARPGRARAVLLLALAQPVLKAKLGLYLRRRELGHTVARRIVARRLDVRDPVLQRGDIEGD